MTQDQKVVPLNGAGSRRPDPLEQSAMLPAPLLPVRDQLLKSLRSALSELFDNADDSLFELADRAATNTEQTLFFEAMRVLRLQRHAIEKRCVGAVLQGLLELNRGEPHAAARAFNYDIDTLSLVQPDELEQSVALEGMVGRVAGRNQQALVHLAVRLNSLLKGSVDVRNNPLGPAALGQAFVDSMAGLGLDIRVRLIVLKLFERYVFNGIDSLYQQLNGMLIEAGVLPDLTRTDPQSRRARSAGISREGQAIAAAQGAVDHQQVLSLFSELIGNWRHASGDSALTGLGISGATPMASNELLGLLAQISGEGERQEELSIKAVRQRVRQRLDDQRRQTGETRSLARVDDDVINLVSMLFDFILDDRNLPAALKALVGRLQLPILRVAIADKSFFSLSSHPARRLLNDLARATMGWNDHDDLGKDQLHQLLEDMVGKLLTEPEPQAQLFERLHAGLQSFVEAEQRRAGRFEQRTRDAEEGRARIEAARFRVASLLNDLLLGRTLPVLVVDFLRDSWSQIMQMVWLREGDSSADWRQAAESAAQLIASIEPCLPEQVDARRQSNRALLAALAAQLDLLGNDPSEGKALLERLGALQEAALPAAPQVSSEPPDVAPVDPVAADTAQATAPVAEQPTSAANEPGAELALMVAPVEPAGVPSVHILEPVLDPGPVESEPTSIENLPSVASSQWVEALRPGGWFDLVCSDGQSPQRCKLAAVISFSGKYIFVNRGGMKVAEFGQAALCQLFERGQIRLVDDNQLFDRALESVIGNLRKLQAGKQ
ncbi:DUF1631 domain-containing protein [Pseudomonas sp.]|uniref:DUF1631 domain-containing protein n=1 Tax=Pseudomonas sp. TaxID=306 RepID=UPI00272CF7D3|nr:DUF1631 domain-containing protein [Pseudomonas sp.]